MTIRPENLLILAIFFAFAALEAARVGFFRKQGEVDEDKWVELATAGILLFLTQPLIIISVNALGDRFFANYAGALAGASVWLHILLLLIFDDMSQYWWHRLSHRVPWLYKLHRPHHNAGYLSVRLVYRNNIFYYVMMPGIWFSAVLVFLGLGWVYAVYIVVKLTVISAAHCDVQWDAKLYRIPQLAPLMWLLERTISTPSTHSMHHGKHMSDGITHYKGNYGNLLFFWDILFGTAKISRQRPPEYGVENQPETSLGEQIFWPIIRAKPEKELANK